MSSLHVAVHSTNHFNDIMTYLFKYPSISGHRPYLDVLSWKLYNCGSGRDLPSIVHIHLTVRCKFGVALWFGSEVIIIMSMIKIWSSDNCMYYRMPHPVASSEAAFSGISAALCSPKTLCCMPDFWCCSCLRRWGVSMEYWPRLTLFDRSVDFTVIWVWTSPTPLLGHDAEITGMCSFSAAQWYKPGLHTLYSSRDRAVFRLSIQYYLIHQHHVR